MRLDRFISKSRIIDIKSLNFKDALKELLLKCPIKTTNNISTDTILQDLLDREETMTTCLGSGIGLPHIRLPIQGRPYIFAVGRCQNGLEYEGLSEYRDLRVIFLLLASETEKSYLNVLASLARILQDGISLDKILQVSDLKTFQNQVILAMGGSFTKLLQKDHQFNYLILKEAEKVAKGAKCAATLLFTDVFVDYVDLDHFFINQKIILIGRKVSEHFLREKNPVELISVQSFSNNRLSQLKSAILLGLTRGIINPKDRLCCVAGIPNSNQFDTLVVVEASKEFNSLLAEQTNLLPESVKPEVLERALSIATEIAVEGREGRSVGCFFVIGNVKQISNFTKPLVLNPFYGYDDEDKNILNPFMGETIKEFSSIDGAFIIEGDGVIESAGTLVHAPDYYHELPGGLGTRHSAGLAISLAVDCISIVVSASTGQVTLFRKGQMFPVLDKSSV